MKQNEKELNKSESEFENVLKQKDELIIEKEIEIEQLKEQLRLLNGRSEELDNKITVVIDENNLLRDAIVSLEATCTTGRSINSSRVELLDTPLVTDTISVEGSRSFVKNEQFSQSSNPPPSAQNQNQSSQNWRDRKQSASSQNGTQSYQNRKQSSTQNGNRSYQNRKQSFAQNGNQSSQKRKQSTQGNEQPCQNVNSSSQNGNQSNQNEMLFTIIDPSQHSESATTEDTIINESDLELSNYYSTAPNSNNNNDQSMTEQPSLSYVSPLTAINQGVFSLADSQIPDYCNPTAGTCITVESNTLTDLYGIQFYILSFLSMIASLSKWQNIITFVF